MSVPKFLKAFITGLIICIQFNSFGQSTFNSSGKAGNSDWSFGQVFTLETENSEHSIHTGVIQPFTMDLISSLEGDTWSLNIFPNPTSDKLNIKVNNGEFYNLSMIDMNGRILLTEDILGQEIQLKMPPNIVDGLYILRFSNSSNNSVTDYKIIKRTSQ